jgi:AT-rich interactive domain-containing protein 1
VDVQPVDGWHIVMSLRSGLAMESTWAIDVLNALLYDDNAFVYFGLGNMPGLLEALLEHWRAALIEMFDIGEDLELGQFRKDDPREKKLQLGRVLDIDPDDKEIVLRGENHTLHPRFNTEEVEVKDCPEQLFVVENEDHSWDKSQGIESNSEHWRVGGGNTTRHVVKCFAAELPRKRKTREDETAKIKEEKKEKDEEKEEDVVEKIERLTGIRISDPETFLRRWHKDKLEEECHTCDESSLYLVTESQDAVGKRAVAISTVIRNLSFVPGNEYELARSAQLLAIMGKLLRLHLRYPPLDAKRITYDTNVDAVDEDASVAAALPKPADPTEKETCASLVGECEWWWEYLHVIRENVMVTLANISGTSLDLSNFEEHITLPILDGLLEWAVSTSSYAQDPFPNVGPTSSVSPQRMAIEALTKLCLVEQNVDLMLATPPYSRIERLLAQLSKRLYRYEDPVLREFSVNLLNYLSAADTGVARRLAQADRSVTLLLSFVEQAEQQALMVAQQHGVHALKDNPEAMGTSLDMLRRAANTLLTLSKHPDNTVMLAKHEERLLTLVVSQILDQGVAAILANVLYNVTSSREQEPRKAR